MLCYLPHSVAHVVESRALTLRATIHRKITHSKRTRVWIEREGERDSERTGEREGEREVASEPIETRSKRFYTFQFYIQSK